MIVNISRFIENNTTFIIKKDGYKDSEKYLFAGFRPEEKPDRCILVQDISGGSVFFRDILDRVDIMITVYSRANTYWDSRDDIYEVFHFLHGACGWDLPNESSADLYHAAVVEATNHPIYIGTDDKGRYQFSCSFIFRIHNQ